MKLVECESDVAKRYFPSFIEEKSLTFFLNHKDEDIGIYAICPRPNKRCFISLCIFSEFRFKVPYKEGLRIVLFTPFKLGFNEVLISTSLDSVDTLLRKCSKIGVEYVESFNKEHLFRLRRQL